MILRMKNQMTRHYKKIVDSSLKDDEKIFVDVQPMPPLQADEE